MWYSQIKQILGQFLSLYLVDRPVYIKHIEAKGTFWVDLVWFGLYRTLERKSTDVLQFLKNNSKQLTLLP